MGIAYYPSFEREIEGYESSTSISGKALARGLKTVDAICEQLGVPTISSFYSESAAEAFEKIGEDVPDDMIDEPIAWFDPHEGIRTLDALLAAKDPNLADRSLRQDLEGLKQALKVASNHKTRFRLRIDI